MDILIALYVYVVKLFSRSLLFSNYGGGFDNDTDNNEDDISNEENVDNNFGNGGDDDDDDGQGQTKPDDDENDIDIDYVSDDGDMSNENEAYQIDQIFTDGNIPKNTI